MPVEEVLSFSQKPGFIGVGIGIGIGFCMLDPDTDPDGTGFLLCFAVESQTRGRQDAATISGDAAANAAARITPISADLDKDVDFDLGPEAPSGGRDSHTTKLSATEGARFEAGRFLEGTDHRLLGGILNGSACFTVTRKGLRSRFAYGTRLP